MPSNTGPDTHPHLCWSRHFDNIGKPRPEATWTITYGCQNGHTVTANVCDRCASSLVDGRQHCIVCVRGMVVTSLTERGPHDRSQETTSSEAASHAH